MKLITRIIMIMNFKKIYAKDTNYSGLGLLAVNTAVTGHGTELLLDW